MAVTPRSLLVLTSFISLCAISDAEWFLHSTCDAIKEQLNHIDSAIAEKNIFYQLPPTTSNGPYAQTFVTRLRSFLGNLNGLVVNEGGKRQQMHEFVQTKLKEFSIPVVGLQDDASQLSKVFNHVNERNRFYKQQQQAKFEENKILKETIEQFKREKQGKENSHSELQMKIKDLKEKIKAAESAKQKLQAKINGNVPAIQG